MLLWLNCVCSLLLLPYGLVCTLFSIKNLFDPYFTDEVWGYNNAPPQLNPRMFLYEMDGIMSQIMGVYPYIPYSKVEGIILLCGAIGSFGSWIISVPMIFIVCNYLLLFSGVYFALIVPYSILTNQSEIAPVMISCLLLCLIITTLRAIVIANDPYDKPQYTKPLFIFFIVLVILSTIQTIIMKYNAAKDDVALSIEKFHHVKNHFLGNGMKWSKNAKYPAGYLDDNSLLSNNNNNKNNNNNNAEVKEEK